MAILFKVADSGFDWDSFTGDDFTGDNGAPPNQEIWEEITNSNGYASIQDNKLNFTAPGNNENVYGRYYSKFTVSGDCDLQVDWDLTGVSTPSDGVTYIAILWVIFEGSYCFIALARNSGQSYNYYLATDDAVGQLWTGSVGSTSGKFRFARTGSTSKLYYWTGSQWVWDGNTAGFTASTTNTDDISVRLTFESENNGSLNSNFDNFVIDSGTVIGP